MRTTAVAASALAFAASAMAQVEGFAVMSAPAKDEKVAAGATYSIQWDAGTYTGPIAITLLGGKTPETLEPGAELASAIPITANTFSWDVDCTLGDKATYGLKIASNGDESLFQYSFPFHIDNSGCSEEGGNEGGHGGYPTSVISVSQSGYPTGGPHSGHSSWSSDCDSSTVAPPTTTPAPVYSTSAPPVVSTPIVAPPANTTSMQTYITSAPPTVSATSTPEPSVVPIAAAGRNAAGSLAAVAAIAALVFAL